VLLLFLFAGNNYCCLHHALGIRSYYVPLIAGQELTDAQIVCNNRLRSSRQVIEHSYGMAENVFHIFRRPEQFRLDQANSFVSELLRVGYLVANIHVCLNGNHASSYAKFDCPPPTLEAYLNLDF
jgi:hypothetical protein